MGPMDSYGYISSHTPFFGSDFHICVAQKQETFEDQDLITRDVKRYLH